MTDKEFKKAYYMANSKKIIEKQKAYYQRNRLQRIEYQKQYNKTYEVIK